MAWEIGGAGFAAFLLTFAGCGMVGRFAIRKGILRYPGGRHIHAFPVPLGGGIVLSSVIVLIVLLHPTLILTPQIKAVLVGTVFLVVVGARDDIRELRWPVVLFAQLIAAFFLVSGGVTLSYVNGFWGNAVRLDSALVHAPSFLCIFSPCIFALFGTLLVIGWVLAVVNAFNWLDGSHGVAPSVALAVFATLTALSFHADVMQPPIAILAATGAGASAGLLVWNIVKGPMLLGNAGSFGLGFFLASFAVLAGAKLATVAMVLLLPAADAAAVVVARLALHSRPWKADDRHLHHELLRRGVKSRHVAALFAAVAAIFGILSLEVARPWKLLIFVVGFFSFFTVSLLLKLKREDSMFRKEKVPQ